MRFTSACLHSLLAPVVITAARLSSVSHDDHNNENKQQELLLASSFFSELKPADRVAIRHEVRHELAKLMLVRFHYHHAPPQRSRYASAPTI
jgi:hypothetical protein